MGKFKEMLVEKEDEYMEQSSAPMDEDPNDKAEDDGWETFKQEEQRHDSTEEEDA